MERAEMSAHLRVRAARTNYEQAHTKAPAAPAAEGPKDVGASMLAAWGGVKKG